MRSASLLILLFLTASAYGNPAPEAKATDAEIREAIANLDHAQYKVRSQAVKKLLALGTAAIEPLRQAAETGSIETADRAIKIILELTVNGSDEASRTGREALQRLIKAKGPAREQARDALARIRNQAVDQMEQLGARFHFIDDRIRAVYFDNVERLDKVLPLLREIPEIEEISLSTKKFGDAQMHHLLPLKNLKWLNLFESDVGDESLKLLKNFPDLESIPMGHTRVTDAGLAHLVGLKKLDYLGLRGNAVTDAGLIHVAKITSLTSLTLQETKITDAGIGRLTALEKLSNVRLQNTALTDEGLLKLRDMESLTRLDLTGSKVTAAGAEAMRQSNSSIVIILREGD